MMGEKIGRKEIKKKGRKKERKKVKSTKQKEIKGDGRGGGGGGEEDRMKNRKEKEKKKSWNQVLKPKYCVGTDPVHWYINRHSSNFCYHWSWWLSG